MRQLFLALIVVFILSRCERKKIDTLKNVSIFQIFIFPSFDEEAQIVLTSSDSLQTMDFLLLDREFHDKPVDTFYQKNIELSKEQFDLFDSLVISQTRIKQPKQWTGCCDGMPVEYFTIHGTDTSILYFRSPRINSDSSGYEVTKLAIDKLKIFYNDSIISDYLNDVESYMDESQRHTDWKEDRPINRLRKAKYSR